MIQLMWRSIHLLVLVLAFGACGGPAKVEKGEPQTAKEKQLREAKASGEVYQGDRADCFFLVGRKCFKSETAACQAAKCKAPKQCTTTGGGPATLSCK